MKQLIFMYKLVSQSIIKVVQNGQMEWIGLKWTENGPNWTEVDQTSLKWTTMDQTRLKWTEVNQYGQNLSGPK